MSRVTYSIFGLLAAVVFACDVHGVVIYSDNFESDTVNTTPIGWTGQGVVGDGSATPHLLSKSLSSSATDYVWKGTDHNMTAHVLQAGETVTARWYAARWDPSCRLDFRLNDTTNGDSVIVDPIGSNTYFMAGTTTQTVPLNSALDQWYKVEITKTSTKFYSSSGNGHTVPASWTLVTTIADGMDRINQLQLWTNYVGYYAGEGYYGGLDDILVESVVPEPTATGLAAGVVLACLRRRHAR